MTQAVSSKQAAAYLIDPMHAPEPSAETGPGSHFGSTFAAASARTSTPSSPQSPLMSNNPYRTDSVRSSPKDKNDVTISERRASRGSSSPRVAEYRSSAFSGYESSNRRSGSVGPDRPPPSYDDATSPTASPKQNSSKGHHRRTSSLSARYPGDESHKPLDIIRRDSKKAYKSPHLRKHHLPGADLIDRLDPAIGGSTYHHEGPYDAALLARNSSYNSSPIAALETTNAEALKATPAENIKDAIDRHVPLDGVAIVPPGVPDRFGRTYNYEEGADMMREEGSDGPGYKRWAGKDYSPDDLNGKAEPGFSLDRALQAHHISNNGIELSDSAHINKEWKDAKRRGTLDSRDPVMIAGGESNYVDMQLASTNEPEVKRTGSLRAAGANLKKRIGSIRRKKSDD